MTDFPEASFEDSPQQELPPKDQLDLVMLALQDKIRTIRKKEWTIDPEKSPQVKPLILLMQKVREDLGELCIDANTEEGQKFLENDVRTYLQKKAANIAGEIDNRIQQMHESKSTAANHVAGYSYVDDDEDVAMRDLKARHSSEMGALLEEVLKPYSKVVQQAVRFRLGFAQKM